METDLLMSFVTLSLLEIVLGIDNIIFIVLVTDRLPREFQAKARAFGLALALIIRVGMLASLSWIMGLTEPLFSVLDHEVSWRDLLLIGGGIFLIGKSTLEMHADVGGLQHDHKREAKEGQLTVKSAVAQIILVDLVFSFDSIITAVGLTSNLYVMVAAVVVSMVVMLLASGLISEFLHKYPTFKMLALSFILMIGTLLVAEGMGIHVPKGYIYFAFGFSLFVEGLNTAARAKREKRSK
jgi:predicted tellurium resistance membrane protein TerC